MYYDTRPFRDWDKRTQTKLKKLTFRYESIMKEVIIDDPGCQTFVYFRNKQPISWVIATWKFHGSGRWSIMLFTQVKYRKQGYARELYQEAMIWCHSRGNGRRRTQVFKDPRNKGFFNKVTNR